MNRIATRTSKTTSNMESVLNAPASCGQMPTSDILVVVQKTLDADGSLVIYVIHTEPVSGLAFELIKTDSMFAIGFEALSLSH